MFDEEMNEDTTLEDTDQSVSIIDTQPPPKKPKLDMQEPPQPEPQRETKDQETQTETNVQNNQTTQTNTDQERQAQRPITTVKPHNVVCSNITKTLPIQIHWHFCGFKNEDFKKKFFNIFLILAQKIQCGCSLKPPPCVVVYFLCDILWVLIRKTHHNIKVQVGKDQEKAQSEKDSHSKNQGGKKPN